jgi:hypothetical protein
VTDLLRDCTCHQSEVSLRILPLAQRIALSRRLDLDHLGAKVG